MSEASRPTVSVVIATYNRSSSLGRSIRSVLEQTYNDLELIVVDDASSDNTAEVVLGFIDKRMRYVRRDKNGNCPAARNTGIIASTGKFVAFNDDDDEWLPDKLERQMKVFEVAPAHVGVVYCDFWVVRNGEKELYKATHIMPEDGMPFRRALAFPESGIWLQTAVFRRECFEKAGMLDETLPNFSDAEIFFRVCRQYRLHHISIPLMNLWLTPGSMMSNHEAIAEDLKAILLRYWGDIRTDSRLKTKYLMKLSWETHLVGQHTTACKYLARGLITSPSECLAYLLKYLKHLRGSWDTR